MIVVDRNFIAVLRKQGGHFPIRTCNGPRSLRSTAILHLALMTELTLLRQRHELAEPAAQVDRLNSASGIPEFAETLADHGLPVLAADKVEILQINVGKLCNQTCSHCHVDAGPDRREIMMREIFEDCLQAIAGSDIETVDITGGAPEMNPHFRWFVTEVRQLGRRVIDRCNLTILLANGYEDLAEFLAGQGVEIVASLPCYLEENTDRQRGAGVFRKSIEALRKLNALGYGTPGGDLELSLVYNPVGFSLPSDQQQLEDAYREQLRSRFGIEFTRLYTVTNMPISRFLEDLIRQEKFEDYLQKLVQAFNPATVSGVMCRNMLSVDYRGYLYDCDFNQMLDLPLAEGQPRHIRDFAADVLAGRPIVTARHCFGCTAGAGSSCQGAVT
jgi:radical SAM/Cys-rich protein